MQTDTQAAHPPPAAMKQPAAATMARGPVAAPRGKPVGVFRTSLLRLFVSGKWLLTHGGSRSAGSSATAEDASGRGGGPGLHRLGGEAQAEEEEQEAVGLADWGQHRDGEGCLQHFTCIYQH